MVEGACEYNFEEECTEPEDMFGCLKGTIETLQNIYTEKILDENTFVNILNFEIFKHSETCAFCKCEIKESEHETIVILHTTDKFAIDDLKKLLMDGDDCKIETKPYKHPYEEDITERYKITFSYWDIEDSLKNMEWENLDNSIENTQDSLEY